MWTLWINDGCLTGHICTCPVPWEHGCFTCSDEAVSTVLGFIMSQVMVMINNCTYIDWQSAGCCERAENTHWHLVLLFQTVQTYFCELLIEQHIPQFVQHHLCALSSYLVRSAIMKGRQCEASAHRILMEILTSRAVPMDPVWPWWSYWFCPRIDLRSHLPVLSNFEMLCSFTLSKTIDDLWCLP